jgi:hypothetical protein
LFDYLLDRHYKTRHYYEETSKGNTINESAEGIAEFTASTNYQGQQAEYFLDRRRETIEFLFLSH